MLGSLLSSAIRIATLPIDAASAGIDILGGGDGSKESRMDQDLNPAAMAERLRDAIARAAREIDEE